MALQFGDYRVDYVARGAEVTYSRHLQRAYSSVLGRARTTAFALSESPTLKSPPLVLSTERYPAISFIPKDPIAVTIPRVVLPTGPLEDYSIGLSITSPDFNSLVTFARHTLHLPVPNREPRTYRMSLPSKYPHPPFGGLRGSV